MNRLIELHDSVIEKIEQVQGNVVITFSHAYIHESSGRPGIDSGTVWSQRAVFTVKSNSKALPDIVWPLLIERGALMVDGLLHDNEIPIPFTSEKAVELCLNGFEDEGHGRPQTITVTGRSAHLKLHGEPEYIEKFNGRDT